MSIRTSARDCASRLAPIFAPSRPLVPLALAVASGILAGSEPMPGWLTVVAAGSLLAASLVLRRPAVIRVGILAGFAAMGALSQMAASVVPRDDASRNADGSLVALEGVVASEPEARGRTVTLILAADRVTVGGASRRCSGEAACALARGEMDRMPEFGDRIVARGVLERPDFARNPGGFDSRAHLAQREIFCTLYVRRPGAWSVQPMDAARAGFAGAVHRLSANLRASLQASASRRLPPAEASLLGGILVGARTALPPALDEDFQRTGTSHILATAGLHVGLAALLLGACLRGLGLSRRGAAGVIICAMTVYAVAAGGRPSVMRAVLVTNLYLAGYLLDREPDGANSLAAAALAILHFRPGALFDAGFQLSFATVGTILWILPVMQRAAGLVGGGAARLGPRRPRIGERAREGATTLCGLTLAAQIGSAPLVARYFNLASPSGLPANLLIVPALFPILGLGFLFWLASAMHLPLLPDLLAWMLHPFLAFVIGAARMCSEMPLASVPVPSPGWPAVAVCYGLIGWAGWAARRVRPSVFTRASAEPALDKAAR